MTMIFIIIQQLQQNVSTRIALKGRLAGYKQFVR